MKTDWLTRAVLILIWAFVIITIAATAWLLLEQKKYSFTVEAACDPATEVCFHRDCSISDNCPPSNIDDYKVYKISAADFQKCTDNSCQNECAKGIIACEEMTCGQGAGDSCSDNPESSSQ